MKFNAHLMLTACNSFRFVIAIATAADVVLDNSCAITFINEQQFM